MSKLFLWVFTALVLLHFSSTLVDVMDIDASQYAEMSREMMTQDQKLFLYDRGKPYLDKPPMLIWLSAASMSVFGVNNFGYKFPSIVFALITLFATYRLGKILYNKTVGQLAALVLGVCQGFFLMTNDIRTDTLMMGFMTLTFWFFKEWESQKKLKWLLAAFASIAFGMMTKGPFAIMLPAMVVGLDWLIQRKFKHIFHPQHFLCFLLLAALLFPMSWGLFAQFDQHPETTVNGLNQVSGLRFFYWSQSFGRLTGESPWNNGAYFSFLFENMLWSFLPWILIFIAAWIWLFKRSISKKSTTERFTIIGFTLAYVIMANSKYQLPHYIFPVFPLAAIMVAAFVFTLVNDVKCKMWLSIFNTVQLTISALLMLAVGAILVFVFPAPVWVILIWALFFILLIMLAYENKWSLRMILIPAFTMMVANLFMTNYFYKNLLTFQAGSTAGRYIRHHISPEQPVKIFEMKDPLNSVHFYAQRIIKGYEGAPVTIEKGDVVITDITGKEKLEKENFKTEILYTHHFFKVSELTGPFVYAKTRPDQLGRYFILKLK